MSWRVPRRTVPGIQAQLAPHVCRGPRVADERTPSDER
jgi:hypothetical protein